ncbi:hypothetical protein Y032_0701g1653 [Ancylostoma ceylanicum]|uniref:Uncharacterized protein n=2 Tax=Ancylostoma ceylanicum TaxID=53326 RepID=A0A016WGE3_9BILA|nr:hypothetical protein Y032_0701g1653 [Ancylostoma ceylanicum]
MPLAEGEYERHMSLARQMRRQLTRSGLRRYLYTAAAILLLFLMYRWLTRRPEYSSMYGYRGERPRPSLRLPKINLLTSHFPIVNTGVSTFSPGNLNDAFRLSSANENCSA